MMFHGNPTTNWWRISSTSEPPSLRARTTDFFAGDGGFPHRFPHRVVYGISNKYMCIKNMYLLYTWEIDIIKKTKHMIICIYLHMYIYIYINLNHLHIRNLPIKHQPATSNRQQLHLGDVGSNLLNLQRFTVVRASGKRPSCGLGRFKQKPPGTGVDEENAMFGPWVSVRTCSKMF